MFLCFFTDLLDGLLGESEVGRVDALGPAERGHQQCVDQKELGEEKNVAIRA